MKEITHRQLRNDSGEVLRRAASGETLLVTNNGQPTAVIGPPPVDVLSHLSTLGQLRAPTRDPGQLRSVSRKRTKKQTAEIVDDVRGPW